MEVDGEGGFNASDGRVLSFFGVADGGGVVFPDDAVLGRERKNECEGRRRTRESSKGGRKRGRWNDELLSFGRRGERDEDRRCTEK